MTAERCCLIIDAQPVVRLGVRRLLEPDWEFEELADGRGAVDLLNSVGRIEVAIVEIRPAQPGVPSGTKTIRSLLDAEPGLGVVAHGGRAEGHAVREALDAGAGAYVSKCSAPKTMRSAVRSVLELEPFVDPEVDHRVKASAAITRRQRQVLQLLADGHSTDGTSKRLGLSAETVRKHVTTGLPRLGARNRTHAVAIALRDGLID